MDFYIKSITAYAYKSGREDSTIEFSPGVNLIVGASDTGKSAVLRCIKFMFGGEKPFDHKAKGFNRIVMVLQTVKGEITLSRYIGRNRITVESEALGVMTGEFSTDYPPEDKKKNQPTSISHFWFSLYGIPGDPMIMWRMVGDRRHLTMKTILRSFYLDENDIDNPDSVILPPRESTQVHFLSAMLYFLTGEEYSEQKLYDTNAISQAKREAVELFAQDRIAALSRLRSEAEKELKRFDGINVEAKLEQSLLQLSKTEKSLHEAFARQQALSEMLSRYNDEEADLTLILSRNHELATQYRSDIDRLVFLTEGDKLLGNQPSNTTCPFCQNTIEPIVRPSYAASNRAELVRITRQAEGLAESEKDVMERLSNIRSEIKSAKSESSRLQTMITKQLTPLAEQLRRDIIAYRHYIQVKNTYDLYQQISKDEQETLDSPEFQAKEPDTVFKPRDHFPTDFVADMGAYATEILTESHYKGFNVVQFLFQPFDLLINGVTKQEEHGKGYNSFINTVMGLTMRRYYIERAKYNPGLFIVDTPFHGFDEGQVIKEASMVHGLFEYLISQNGTGQIIVVENGKNIPVDIDFEGRGINVIDFHKNNSKSRFKNNRYGFLIGVTGK